jgi:4-amino-4-deoxy-L-arabinose transferase-like glycosyltransferase
MFWPLTAALLTCLAAVQVLSIRGESQTWDEHFELASGYSYLKTGDYRINTEQPPLAKIIQALPLLFMQASVPLNDPSWEQRDPVRFGAKFLYHNRIPADTMLFAGRLMSILMTSCLALAVAVWTRWRFGAGVALFALLLLTFDPTVIAHGRYIKQDVPVTLFAFLSCVAWGRSLILVGVFFGLALAAKFSAVFLLPVYALLYLVNRRQQGKRFSPLLFAKSMTAVGIIACLIVLVVYLPHIGMLKPVFRADRQAHPNAPMLRDINKGTMVGATLAWIGARLGLQAHPALTGFNEFVEHASQGHQSYLLGAISGKGFWYYFPVAFAVKTPTATLLALLLSAWLAIRNLRVRLRQRTATLKNEGMMAREPSTNFDWYVLCIPIVIYAGVSLASNVDIGIRHLLPIYPFLFIAMSSVLIRSVWKFKRPTLAALAILLIVESASIYPHYPAFFNTVSGGPRNGPRYLLDSNIDWGQDAKNLKAWMVAHNIPAVCGCYFGNADLGYYKIEMQDLPSTWETEQRAKLNCVAAVSVTPLYGLYVPKGSYAWLREREPMERIGYSIYLYDLRKGR